VEWSWRAARRVEAFDRVVVATDSEEVADAVRGFGGDAMLTDPGHDSGTGRVAEAARRAGDPDVVVNFQADEPFLPPGPVGRAVRAVADDGAQVATLAGPVVRGEEWRSRSVVKVACDRRGRALYFSRAPIPWRRDGEPDWSTAPRDEAPGEDWPWLHHVGLYAFRREALDRWTALPPSALEASERLEQLRALEAGIPIRVIRVAPVEPGVDDEADLRRADRILRSGSHHPRDEAHV
jgi:3-deoxy-manno-octulosonate cytidylyltransferase (CMP-KDO synthetase)